MRRTLINISQFPLELTLCLFLLILRLMVYECSCIEKFVTMSFWLLSSCAILYKVRTQASKRRSIWYILTTIVCVAYVLVSDYFHWMSENTASCLLCVSVVILYSSCKARDFNSFSEFHIGLLSDIAKALIICIFVMVICEYVEHHLFDFCKDEDEFICSCIYTPSTISSFISVSIFVLLFCHFQTTKSEKRLRIVENIVYWIILTLSAVVLVTLLCGLIYNRKCNNCLIYAIIVYLFSLSLILSINRFTAKIIKGLLLLINALAALSLLVYIIVGKPYFDTHYLFLFPVAGMLLLQFNLYKKEKRNFKRAFVFAGLIATIPFLVFYMVKDIKLMHKKYMIDKFAEKYGLASNFGIVGEKKIPLEALMDKEFNTFREDCYILWEKKLLYAYDNVLDEYQIANDSVTVKSYLYNYHYKSTQKFSFEEWNSLPADFNNSDDIERIMEKNRNKELEPQLPITKDSKF